MSCRRWFFACCGGILPVLVMLLMIFLRLGADFEILQQLINKDSLAWRITAGIALPICMGAILAQTLHSEKDIALFGRCWGKSGPRPRACSCYCWH